jgi:hypothetical protein
MLIGAHRYATTPRSGGIMTDQELLTTIAITLATKTAEGLVAGGRSAFESLARLIRRRLEGRQSTTPLPQVWTDTADDTRIETLRKALAQAIADDPPFEAELRNHWQSLSPYVEVQDGGVINHVGGNVEGNVV